MARDNEIKDLREFNKKYGFIVHDSPTHLATRKLVERYDFMLEELTEFLRAAADQDMEGIADALVDLVYVAKGTAVMLGLPWEDMWNEVHRANMAKVRGTTHRKNKSDVTKPKGWQPPNHVELLVLAGYLREKWFTREGKFNDKEAVDDSGE